MANLDAQIRQIVQQEMAKQNQRNSFNLNATPNHRHTGKGQDGPQINSNDLIPGLRTSGSVTFTSAKSYRFNTNFQPSLITFYGNPYHASGGTNGEITSVLINNGGSSYVLGDILNVAGGTGGTVRVNGVSGGNIIAVVLQTAGTGYTTSNGVATTGGSGFGATVDIVANPIGAIDRHTFVFGQAALGQNLYFQPDTSKSVKVGGSAEIVQTSTMFMALGSGSGSSFQAVASQEHLINVQESGSVTARATITDYGPNFFTVTVSTLASGWIIVGNYFVT